MQSLIEILIRFFLLIVLGFATATLGLCFYHFQDKDMIFAPYSKWLNKMAYKSIFWRYLTMPLGRCPYCNTTWIAIVVYIYYFSFSLEIFLFIGIVWFFVKSILHEIR